MLLRQMDSPAASFCKVSELALKGNPKENKNYRNNPSFLIHHYDEQSGTFKNVLIDVGKTFREGALRWFQELGVESLDAIVLTHEHMDAAAGLDDVRGFQRFHPDHKRGQRPRRIPVPVYLSAHCHEKLQGQFPWLFPKAEAPKITSDGKPVVHRDVAGLIPRVFENYQTMNIDGVEITPLPVWHGEDLIAHGFAIQVKSKTGTPTNVVYLSDISRIVPETLEFIQTKLPQTDILVVDALLPDRNHNTHFSFQQAVEMKEKLQPTMQTYLIGMSCESYPPHQEFSKHLEANYDGVTMAHDGLVIEVKQ